jgi:predicted AAA+ superfamily ATPase
MIATETLKELIRANQQLDFALVPRDVQLVKIKKIFTIIGPRRAGKTYFLFQLMKTLPRERIIYLNFEDERLAGLAAEDLQKILDAYFELYPNAKGQKVYLLFDEIQNVPLWSKFIRRLYDAGVFEIYVTGSSAKLLSKELATELRGRAWTCKIYPFSFSEFLLFNKLDPAQIYEQKYKIRKLFFEYLNWGGFPETLSQDEYIKAKLLQNYVDLVIYRDVIERHKVRQTAILDELVKYLIQNFSREISIKKIYNLLKTKGYHLTKDILYEFVKYLEDTLYFYFVPIYSKSKKQQLVRPKKVYLVDNGLARAYILSDRLDKGWLYENAVFGHLLRKEFTVFYFKKNLECDFVAMRNRDKIAIQVTLKPEEPRELEGLLEAMAALGVKQGIIVTEDLDKELIIKGKKIVFMPLWRFLLKF